MKKIVIFSILSAVSGAILFFGMARLFQGGCVSPWWVVAFSSVMLAVLCYSAGGSPARFKVVELESSASPWVSCTPPTRFKVVELESSIGTWAWAGYRVVDLHQIVSPADDEDDAEYETVCECGFESDAEFVCAALNRYQPYLRPEDE